MRMYGEKKSGGVHFTSLILHLLNIVFLYLLFNRLGFKFYLSGMLVMFFALHPIQVEAVAWISARSTLLFTLFYIIALLFYTRFAENRNTASFVATFFFFLLSLFSKPSAASFFLFIPVIEYWFFPKLTYRTLLRMLLFAVPAAVMLFITFSTRNDSGMTGLHQQAGIGFFMNAGYAMWSVVLYIKELLFPLKQQVVRLYPEFRMFMFLIPAIILILFVATMVRVKKYHRVLILSVSFFLIPLSVHLKFIPFGDFLMADRYTYLSAAGIFIMPVFFISELRSLRKYAVIKYAGSILVILVIASYTYLTFHNKKTWKNNLTLWSHVVDEHPDYFLGYYNRGIAYRDKGFLPEAISDFSDAALHNPDFSEIFMARGSVFSLTGDYSKAIQDYSTVIRTDSNMYKAYFNRANAEYNTGEYINALNDYREFLSFEPLHEEASFYKILSMIHLDYSVHELNNELTDFIRKYPDNSDGYYFRGIVILDSDIDSACQDFRKAANLGHKDAQIFCMKFCY